MTPSPKIATHSQSMYQSSKKSFRHTFNAKLMKFGFFAKISCLFAKNMATNQTKYRIDQCQNVPLTFFGTNIWSDQYFCLICSHFFAKKQLIFAQKSKLLQLCRNVFLKDFLLLQKLVVILGDEVIIPTALSIPTIYLRIFAFNKLVQIGSCLLSSSTIRSVFASQVFKAKVLFLISFIKSSLEKVV